MSKDKYIVWRRNDGYVSSSANHSPPNYNDVTFDILGTYDNWGSAYELILIEGSKEGSYY